MSRHLGLIIGVNQYQDSSFQQLQFAENDARALAQWLVNTKGGRWSPPDVQLVQGQHATRELAESLITQICIYKAEPGDVVFLYFAGHAFVDETTGEGYLSLFNSRYQDVATSINLLSFTQQIIARSQASHIICIFDCFQNGRFWQTRRASPYDSKPLLGPTLLTTLQQLPNRLFFCSCRGNERAPESGERNLGLMAHATIFGLCGPAADPGTGTITLSGLHAYLFNTLGEQQKPQLFGQQLTPLILVGELPAPTPTRSFAGPSSEQLASYPTPTPDTYSNSRLASGGLLLKPTTFPGTAAPQTQTPFMSGRTLTSDEPRQQQNQQMIDQARQLFQAQNYEQAFSLVEQVLSLAPADPSALTLKGQLLAVAGRFPEAGVIIDQLIQINPNNAMSWSMRAVALTNMGNHQEALIAVERSLELDSQNPETYALKNTITANIAFVQSQTNKHAQHKFTTPEKRSSTSTVFALGLGLHLLGLLIGFASFAVLIVLRSAPAPVALFLISISLTIMCVNAARGAFRYGFVHLLLALFLSLIAGGILGLAYRVGMTGIINQLKLHPSILVPLIFLTIWLASAAVIPLLLAFGGLVSGIVRRSAKRR